MTGFPKPPITQWQVLIIRDDEVLHRIIVNDFANLGSSVGGAIDRAAEEGDDEVRVEGRRRLNDYVGPPIWSEWERVIA